jgi:hypothetical protein
VETTPKIIGVSRDLRTNRWRVTCPKCEKAFEPVTTMLSTQTFHCENARCRASLFADYNAAPPVVRLILANDEAERAMHRPVGRLRPKGPGAM